MSRRLPAGARLLPDLSRRALVPELMEGADLERERHLRALDALARVNALSLSARRVWREVREAHRRGARPVRVLDVACGGGDVLRAVAGRARRAGVAVELVGCDASEGALERARTRAGGRAELRYERVDVVREPLPAECDVVSCILFLHHLAGAEACALLAAMARSARRVLLVQDLRRSALGYALAWAALRVLTRSDVARHDGPASVRAALTTAEAGALAREAGLEDAEVKACWPQRFTLRWERR